MALWTELGAPYLATKQVILPGLYVPLLLNLYRGAWVIIQGVDDNGHGWPAAKLVEVIRR